jgi:hypothetical protein
MLDKPPFSAAGVAAAESPASEMRKEQGWVPPVSRSWRPGFQVE